MKNYHRGLWLVLSTAFISGCSVWINSLAVQSVQPTLLTGIKNLSVGVVCIGLLLITRHFSRIRILRSKQWAQLIIIGLIGGGVPFILFFNGLAATSGAQAGFIHKTLFIYVTLFAAFLLRERIGGRVIFGIVALFAGQILFLNITPFKPNFGDLLVFAATVLWAIEIVVSKRLLSAVSPNIVAGARMLFGGLFIWVYIAVSGEWQTVATLSTGDIMWIIITSVLLIGYVLTFYHGLARVPAHVATSILALGAPVTILLSAVFQEKTLTMQQVGSMIVIALAITVITRFVVSKKKEPLYVSEKNYS